MTAFAEVCGFPVTAAAEVVVSGVVVAALTIAAPAAFAAAAEELAPPLAFGCAVLAVDEFAAIGDFDDGDVGSVLLEAGGKAVDVPVTVEFDAAPDAFVFGADEVVVDEPVFVGRVWLASFPLFEVDAELDSKGSVVGTVDLWPESDGATGPSVEDAYELSQSFGPLSGARAAAELECVEDDATSELVDGDGVVTAFDVAGEVLVVAVDLFDAELLDLEFEPDPEFELE